MILCGLPLLAYTTWQMSGLDMTTTDTQIKMWLFARGAAMGLVMMPAMTAGLNAVAVPQISRASAMTNVMRQIFGAFGTALVVTILQSRTTFHTAILSQTLTPQNVPFHQLLTAAQKMAAAQGMSTAQSLVMGAMFAAKQVGQAAAVMGFDDVFRVTAVVTLLAIFPALFMKTTKQTGPRPTTIVTD